MMDSALPELCPLCASDTLAPFQQAEYLRCGKCFLIVKVARLSRELEKARYLLHTNNINDAGYRNFLAPVRDAVATLFSKGARGLDFGSGPVPALTDWLNSEGYQVTPYDVYFKADGLGDAGQFDFICCIETAEHFARPLQEFQSMFSRLHRHGALIMMTALYQDGQILKDWSYANDKTHICFYSRKTLEWVEKHFGVHLHFINDRLFVFLLDDHRSRQSAAGKQFDINL